MNKKVLSAILFSALFAGTGTFTSCIDNDEPAGIEELRGAKAELIRAKVAVEQAEAAFKLAQAEVQKAEAARLESLAKINEASARLEEARAEAQEIQNEEDRAVLEKTIAEYEMYLEEQTVKHELTMVQNQQNLAVAKRQYELALKSIEIAEALMSEKAQVWVSDLKKDVNRLLWAVERKEAQIKKQQDALYDAAKYIGAETEFQIAQAEYNLNAAKATLEANALEIAKYESYMAIDTAATESDWRAEIAEIEAEIAEVDKKMADYQLELVKNKESEETKALEKAIKDAEDAKNEIKAPKVAEDLTYAYKFFGVTQTVEDKQKVEGKIAKNTAAVTAIDLITGEGNTIDQLKKEKASYTQEKQAHLNKIAASETLEDADYYEKAYTTAKTTWTTALANYNGAITLSTAKMYKAATATAEASGALVTYEKANYAAEAKMTKAQNRYNASSKTADDEAELEEAKKEYAQAIMLAKQNFADAIVAFYNELPAAQVTLRTITLATEVDDETIYASKTAKEWLSDASLKHKNLDKLYAYFNKDITALWDKGATAEVKNADGSVKTATEGVFATWIEKSSTTETAAGIIAKLKANEAVTPTTLFGKLVVASYKAFGEAANYLAGSEYLSVEPNSSDAEYVGYDKAGAYGDFLGYKDTDYVFQAKNLEAILADLDAAIEYWTAAAEEMTEEVEAYEAELDEADKAIAAAQKAFDDHKKVFVDAFNNAVVGLQEKIASLKNVKFALINAVDAYLANEFANYEGEAKFMEFLAEELVAAQEMTAVLKYNVAVAEADLKAAKDGKFYDAELVKAEEEKLAKLEEDLAELLEKLEAKLAELATAEEIWAGK